MASSCRERCCGFPPGVWNTGTQQSLVSCLGGCHSQAFPVSTGVAKVSSSRLKAVLDGRQASEVGVVQQLQKDWRGSGQSIACAVTPYKEKSETTKYLSKSARLSLGGRKIYAFGFSHSQPWHTVGV